jgi:hypothetical protein
VISEILAGALLISKLARCLTQMNSKDLKAQEKNRAKDIDVSILLPAQ